VVLAPLVLRCLVPSSFFVRINIGKRLLMVYFMYFVFVTCKVIYSKYMWNSVNSKCICDITLLVSPFYELIDGRISLLVIINMYLLVLEVELPKNLRSKSRVMET
jgi:hypothetical protein